MEVPSTGIVEVAETAACRGEVALARIRSTLEDTKPLMMVAQLVLSPEAFCSLKVTASPRASVKAALKPSVAASRAGCCTSWQMPTV